MPLSPAARDFLHRSARATLGALHAGPPRDPPPPALEAELCAHRGIFVSLYSPGGELRGCIGALVAREPLWQLTIDMTIAAATRDPRFAPVREDECAGLAVELSVLSPPRETAAEAVQPGVHGLIITRGGRRGVLLPQVAVEWGFSREEFLSRTAEKAGLPGDAWTLPGTRIETFTAEVFGDAH